MTDLLRVLPTFPVGPFANLLPALEKHGVTTSDLLTLDAADIGKRTQLPLLDVRRLCNAVLAALHADLRATAPVAATATPRPPQPRVISTLDPALDRALGGGIPAGYVTEVAGESGAGKTQFLLTLLLAVQLPPPRGLGRPALYLSTEAPLSTRRLQQLLTGHPAFRSDHGRQELPNLDGIVSTVTPDLESQDHILSFQVPVEVERRGVGLLVVDSVAANYRAEFDGGPGRASAGTSIAGPHGAGSSTSSSNMGARGVELVRLGMQLRELARKHGMAVVVANQVADRFTDDCGLGGAGAGVPSRTLYSLRKTTTTEQQHSAMTSPLARRSNAPHPLSMASSEPTSSLAHPLAPVSSLPEGQNEGPPVGPPPAPESTDPNALISPVLYLDHQQRWFTGWGDEHVSDDSASGGLKTPSLGLVWSTQIAARIVLLKKPVWGVGKRKYQEDNDEEASGTPAVRSWRRWMKVVFAPYAPSSGPGVDGAVEFEITTGGLRGIESEAEE